MGSLGALPAVGDHHDQDLRPQTMVVVESPVLSLLGAQRSNTELSPISYQVTKPRKTLSKGGAPIEYKL